jgi:hypothetical protein
MDDSKISQLWNSDGDNYTEINFPTCNMPSFCHTKTQAKSTKKLCHIYSRPEWNEGSPEAMHPNYPINKSVPANKFLDE